MQNDDKNKKSIQDKLTTIKYNCDDTPHLVVNQSKCEKCKEKICTFICPAGVYSVDESTNEIIVQYENCLECGACRISCPKGSLGWIYPKAGCGVVFKQS